MIDWKPTNDQEFRGSIGVRLCYLEGVPIPELHYAEEKHIVLTEQTAGDWVSHVMQASVVASFETAVLHQMSHALEDALEDRKTKARDSIISWSHTRKTDPHYKNFPSPFDEIRLAPAIDVRRNRPMVVIVTGESIAGMWTSADAQAHCVALVEMMHVRSLSTAYRRLLVDTIDVGEETATELVENIQEYWPVEPDTLAYLVPGRRTPHGARVGTVMPCPRRG
jgi:hypothetical protein